MTTLPYLDRICAKRHTALDIKEDFQAYVDSLKIPRNSDAIKIICYIGVYGVASWRIFTPMMELAKDPRFDIQVSTLADIKDNDWADILYFERCGNRKLVEQARDAKKKGKIVIWETDDYVHNHPIYNPAKMTEKDGDFLSSVEEICKMADAIAISTERLKIRYSEKFGDKMTVLPNLLQKEHWQFKGGEEKLGTVNIMYAGGNSHSGDVETITDVIAQVIKENDNARLLTVGWDGITKARQGDRFYFQDSFSGVPEEKRIGFIWTDYPHRIGRYLQYADISIAPLAFNQFNECKSNVKVLEASILNIPIITTNIEPYNYDPENNPAILIKHNRFDKWHKELTKLVKYRDYREMLGEKNKEYVMKNFLIENKIHLWVDFFTNLMKGVK